MDTVTVTLPRSFAAHAVTMLGNAAFDASRQYAAPGVRETATGAALIAQSVTLRHLADELTRAIGLPEELTFDLDASDCDPLSGQEYGTGA